MTDVRALKDQATQYLLKGKLPAALEAWQKIVIATPNDLAAHAKVAELLAKLGKKADSVRVYEEVARKYAEQGLFFKASATCRVILAIDPQHVKTQELIASLFARDKAPSLKVVSTKPAPVPDFDIDLELEPEPTVTASGLPPIPLFSTLSRNELQEVVARAMEVRPIAPGEVIVAEGAAGDAMFALVEGTASVFRGHGTPLERKVADVKTGDIFGEAAMVTGAPRLATVVADTEAVALMFPRKAIDKVVAKHAHVGRMLEQFYRQRLLANVLRASPILRTLSDDDKHALALKFQPVIFSDGQTVITEGAAADSVYVLLRGCCSVTHASGQRYVDLREGDLFGEVGVLKGRVATATVASIGASLALRLSADDFSERVLNNRAAMIAVEKLVQQRLLKTAELDHDSRV
ncbi:MAG: cyclic nucleotide-binding domain-containing protein [Archangium sp.]